MCGTMQGEREDTVVNLRGEHDEMVNNGRKRDDLTRLKKEDRINGRKGKNE